MSRPDRTPAAAATAEPVKGSLRDDIKDAITPRAFVLVLGVMLLQLGFIASFIGAFHAPKPHEIDVAVVAPAAQGPRVAAQLNAISGTPLHARVVPSVDVARAAVVDGDISAALIVDPSSTTDQLFVASGGGASIVTAVETVATQAGVSQHRTVQTSDLVPLQSGDARGLSGFYLVAGWLVGGYLVASMLGIAKGERPPTVRRIAIRLTTLVPYAIVSGLLGALVAGPWIGALDGHVLALGALGALVVFAAVAATTAFQVVLGVSGVGLAVLIFVVLGNPSAGGAYQIQMLPWLWRTIGNALPNGAGTDSVRRIVYFDGHGISTHLLVLAAWAVVGTVVSLLAARRRVSSAS